MVIRVENEAGISFYQISPDDEVFIRNDGAVFMQNKYGADERIKLGKYNSAEEAEKDVKNLFLTVRKLHAN